MVHCLDSWKTPSYSFCLYSYPYLQPHLYFQRSCQSKFYKTEFRFHSPPLRSLLLVLPKQPKEVTVGCKPFGDLAPHLFLTHLLLLAAFSPPPIPTSLLFPKHTGHVLGLIVLDLLWPLFWNTLSQIYGSLTYFIQSSVQMLPPLKEFSWLPYLK